MREKRELATFAGGCFWCTTKAFDELEGIERVVSGYTGGVVENPTYEQVLSHTTGHTEATQITFNPDIFPYKDLVEFYWTITDPTDAFGQFQDRGENYRPVIFYHSEEQRKIAEESKRALEESGKFSDPIVTTIEVAQKFWLAEDYHQNFHKKNPKRMAIEEVQRIAYTTNQEEKRRGAF